MYHKNFGGMHYEVANRVEVFDPPRAISWLPGQGDDDADRASVDGSGATTLRRWAPGRGSVDLRRQFEAGKGLGYRQPYSCYRNELNALLYEHCVRRSVDSQAGEGRRYLVGGRR